MLVLIISCLTYICIKFTRLLCVRLCFHVVVVFFQLRKEFGPRIVAKFPPRKLLSLTLAQVEERRVHLERYLQSVCQDPGVATSSLFISFFLNAQKVRTS